MLCFVNIVLCLENSLLCFNCTVMCAEKYFLCLGIFFVFQESLVVFADIGHSTVGILVIYLEEEA